MMKVPRTTLLGLLGILVAAGILRSFINDSPFPNHVFERHDEIQYVGRVMNFLNGRWEIPDYINPTFQSYLITGTVATGGLLGSLVGFFDSFADFRLAATISPKLITVVGRSLSVFFGMGAVVLLFVLGRKTISPRAGLIASAAIAVNLTHAERSMLAGNETTTVFIVLLAALAIVRWMERPSAARHALAGVLIGVSAATKFNGGLVGVGLVVATLAVFFQSTDRRSLPTYLVGFCTAPLAFLAASPDILWNLPLFFEGLSTQAGYMVEGSTVRDVEIGERGWFYLLRKFGPMNAGWPFAFACGVACPFAFFVGLRNRRPALLVFVTTVLFAWVFLGSGIFQRMRFLLPVVPFALLLGAWVLDEVLRQVGRLVPFVDAPVFSIGFTIALFAGPFATTYAHQQSLYGAPHSLADLSQWVIENLDTDEVYLEINSTGIFRLLERKERFERFGLGEGEFQDPRERGRLRYHLAGRPASLPLHHIMRETESLEELVSRIEASPFRRLVVVLRTEHRLNISSLPQLVSNPAVTTCSYWNELVTWMSTLPRFHYMESDDRRWCLSVLELPGG